MNENLAEMSDLSIASYPGDAEGDSDRKFVVALARGLEVLRAFRPRDGFLGNSEIAERTRLPKPTVTRLTYTLCKLGYLTKVPRLGKYQIAPQAITLGYSALASLGIRRIAKPLMDELADELASPIALGVLDRNRALYIDISRGSSAFTVQLEIGSRIPLAKTAMGWALLAGLAERERAGVFDRLSDHHGKDWGALRRQIDAALKDHRSSGYVRSIGSWRSDINAVGVALMMDDGSRVYALNCGGPPHQFTPEKIESIYAPAMVALARDISMTLNGRESLAAG